MSQTTLNIAFSEDVLAALRDGLLTREQLRSLVPSHGSEGAAGLDMRAAKTVELPPGGVAVVPTGICMEIPKGWEGQVRPRSGLHFKNRIDPFPGTIDSDYRGEILIELTNNSNKAFRVEFGDRIAQMVISPYLTARCIPVESLDGTERGEGGFGSTGIK